MTKRKIDLKEYARRVERLCDFLLDQTDVILSEDKKVVDDLKENSADIQFDNVEICKKPLKGLHEFMKGVPGEPSPTDDKSKVRT